MAQRKTLVGSPPPQDETSYLLAELADDEFPTKPFWRTALRRFVKYTRQAIGNVFTIDGEHNAEFVATALIEDFKKGTISEKKKFQEGFTHKKTDEEIEADVLNSAEFRKEKERILKGSREYQEKVNGPFNRHWLARLLGVRNTLTVLRDEEGDIIKFAPVTVGSILLNALKALVGIDEETASRWKKLTKDGKPNGRGITIFVLKLIPLMAWNIIRGIGAAALRVLTVFTEALPAVIYSTFKALAETSFDKLKETWNYKPRSGNIGQFIAKGFGLIFWGLATLVTGTLAVAAKIVQFAGKALTSPMQSIRQYWNMDPAVMPDYLNETEKKLSGDALVDVLDAKGEKVYKHPIARQILGKFLAILSGLTTLAEYIAGGFFAAKGIMALSTAANTGAITLNPVVKAGVDLAANGITAAAELTPAASAVGSVVATAWNGIVSAASYIGLSLPTLSTSAGALAVSGVGVMAGGSTAIVGSATSILAEKAGDHYHSHALKKVFDYGASVVDRREQSAAQERSEAASAGLRQRGSVNPGSQPLEHALGSEAEPLFPSLDDERDLGAAPGRSQPPAPSTTTMILGGPVGADRTAATPVYQAVSPALQPTDAQRTAEERARLRREEEKEKKEVAEHKRTSSSTSTSPGRSPLGRVEVGKTRSGHTPPASTSPGHVSRGLGKTAASHS